MTLDGREELGVARSRVLFQGERVKRERAGNAVGGLMLQQLLGREEYPRRSRLAYHAQRTIGIEESGCGLCLAHGNTMIPFHPASVTSHRAYSEHREGCRGIDVCGGNAARSLGCCR